MLRSRWLTWAMVFAAVLVASFDMTRADDGRVVFTQDFESGKPWSGEAGVRTEIVPTPEGAGKCMHLLARNAKGWYYSWGPKFTLAPGKKYRVRVRMCLAVAASQPATAAGLRVEFIGREKKRSIDRLMTSAYRTWEGGWQQLECQFVCPDDIVAGSAVLQKGEFPASVEMWVDDLHVAEVDAFTDPELKVAPTAIRGHPRLFFTAPDIAKLQAKIKDPIARPHFDHLKRRADAALSEPVADGKHEWRSRQAMDIIISCAMMHVLTGEKKYAERAKTEMFATDAWDAWVRHDQAPSDLASGETCLAIGCGYDWLYDYLTPEERAKVRDMLLRRGIRPYLTTLRSRMGWSSWSPMNWTAVVDGGTCVGALAIHDESPEAAATVAYARQDIQRLIRGDCFDRDGGYDEGVMYWSYCTYYLSLMAEALRTSLGGDDGLLDPPHILASEWFGIYFTAPDGIIANFSDAYEIEWSRGYGQSYAGLFAARAKDATLRDACLWWADHANNNGGWGSTAFQFLWRPAAAPPASLPPLELAKSFRGIGWAALRSDPALKPAVFLAFKSGNIGANHTNYDLNSFILAAHGQRLTCDPGYGIMDARDHSTVLVNGRGQQRGSIGRILECKSRDGYGYLLGDASNAYGEALSRFRRHVVFVAGGRCIVILDELAAPKPANFQWLLRSKLAPALDGRSATFKAKGATLRVTSLLPVDAKLTTAKGRDHALQIATEADVAEATFVTVLSPMPGDGEPVTASADADKDGSLTITVHTGKVTDRVRFGAADDAGRALLEVRR